MYKEKGVKDNVALVTGASKGIGRVTAELLASRGAKIMAVARNEDELRSLGLPYIVADLSDRDSCIDVVSHTESGLGPVDILICNHGIGSAHEKLVWEQDPGTWRETMAINLDGPYYLSQAVLKGMVKRRYGRLVFTSSTAGQVAEYAGSAYSSSKHGLLGLMRSISQDAGAYGITSNAVLPGWVRTPMAERSAAAEASQRGISVDEIWKEREALYPPGRVVSPLEVAEVIAFLASDASSGVSGEAITVALGSTV